MLIGWTVDGACWSLRAQVSAAPLKLSKAEPKLTTKTIPPRSSERGPVEAQWRSVVMVGSGNPPRSSERGPVEAK